MLTYFSSRGRGYHRGVNLQGPSRGNNGGRPSSNSNRAAADQVARLAREMSTLSVRRGTSATFDHLPKEMRLAIWRVMAGQGRILELTHGFTPGHTHDQVEIAHQSCKIPVVLHICRESRLEAMACGYRIANFGYSEIGRIVRPETWYNPFADTILFGEQTCLTTMMLTFQHFVGNIPSVMVYMSNSMVTCVDVRQDWEGVDILKALHGFDASSALMMVNGVTVGFGGCQGLKEVQFMVKSNAWNFRNLGNRVPTDAIIRPAATQGITRGQVELFGTLSHIIEDLELGASLHNVGVNKWETEATIPKFSFVSLANPLAYDKIQYKYDQVNTDRIGANSVKNNPRFIRNTENTTGAKITVSEPEYPTQMPREIEIVGSALAVSRAKAAIDQYLSVSFVRSYSFVAHLLTS